MTTALAGIDWDAWRTSYPTMTFQEQREFYARVAEEHPVQQSFGLERCQDAFDRIQGWHAFPRPPAVIELGGWDGRLARDMLARPDIVEWRNYEIADVPQACDDLRYYRVLLEDWLWASPIVADVFVACHTIEHLSAHHLGLLVEALRTNWVYLEAPLSADPTDWDGYPGSHVLELGWLGVYALLGEHGYTCVQPGLWRKGTPP